jgi:hypothetical protein
MIDPEEQARVKRAMELKEYRLMDLPGYMEWGEKHLDESPALIAHLDAASIMLHPSQLNDPHEELFEEMLEDLKQEIGIDE